MDLAWSFLMSRVVEERWSRGRREWRDLRECS